MRTLPAIGGVALLAAIGLFTYAKFFQRPAETYGQLVVDSPEIYTRERLVNDRFVEDAWLRRQLKGSRERDFGPEGSLSRRETSRLLGSWGAKATPTAAEPEPSPGLAQRSAAAQFRSELSYRGEIRNLIIENQLDDRHDLRGNSLYRLKFDASVLPGDNTRANALISVTLKEPPHQTLSDKDLLFSELSPKELKRWRGLYLDWIKDVDANINQAIIDLRHEYDHERFSEEYIKEMIDVVTSLREEKKCDDINGDDIQTLQAMKVNMDWSKSDLLRADFDLARKCEISRETKFRGFNKNEGVDKNLQYWSVDEIINRFAAPKLLQLTFGSGNIGGQIEEIALWTFLHPYADLFAIYTSKEHPFKPQPRKATLRIVPADQPVDDTAERRVEKPGDAPQSPGRAGGGSTEPEPGKKPQTGALTIASRDEPVAGDADRRAEQPAGDRQLLSGKDVEGPVSIEPGARCARGYAFVSWETGILDLPWGPSEGFCVAVVDSQTEKTELTSATLIKSEKTTPLGGFLTAMEISLDELTTRFSRNNEVKERLDGVVEGEWAVAYVPIETGLFHFIRTLQESSSVFSYAVTPKQTVQPLSVAEQSDLQSAVSAGVGELAAELAGDRRVGFSGVREQPLVVGYGNAQSGNDASAQIEFGWFISPRVQGAQGAEERKMQIAAQYALTALVSVPAWWDKINIRVNSAWLAHDGTKRPPSWPDDSGPADDTPMTIDLPRDLESISSLLLDRGAGPEIEEGKMDPIKVTACRPAAILLPGRRLWRSAVVTLGAQVADEIHVLPNMRGIIAKFDKVHVPSAWSGPKGLSSVDEPGSNVPVTVWTSQGSRTLRKRAQILAPTGADGDMAFQRMFEAEGACEGGGSDQDPLAKALGRPALPQAQTVGQQ